MIDLDVVRADLRALRCDPGATEVDALQAIARWRGLVGAPRENVTDHLHAAADAARERGRLKDEADAARLVAEEEARLAEMEAERKAEEEARLAEMEAEAARKTAAPKPVARPLTKTAKRKGR